MEGWHAGRAVGSCIGAAAGAGSPQLAPGQNNSRASAGTLGPRGGLEATTTGYSTWQERTGGLGKGRYWSMRGPQMTLYVPGPVLHEGRNELVLLELEAPPSRPTVDLSDEPDFWGPDGPAVAAGGQQASEEPGRRRRVP